LQDRVRPRQSVGFPANLAWDFDGRPVRDLPSAGVPGPDDRVPGLLRLGTESVVQNRFAIGLKIRERNALRTNAHHTEMARHSQQAGRAVPRERREKRFPFAEQLSHSPPWYHWARMGEGLAQQRADVVPAASRKTYRLRRDRLQSSPQS
jgi:hypothetical protein